MYAKLVKKKKKEEKTNNNNIMIKRKPQTTSNMYLTLNRETSTKQTNNDVDYTMTMNRKI